MKKRVLDPDSTCHDQQVFNDTLLYLLVRTSAPSEKVEVFEDLDKIAGEVFEYDYPQKKKEEPKKTDGVSGEVKESGGESESSTK